MKYESKVGTQLTSNQLHILQQGKDHLKDGPVVIAEGIKNIFNIGSILRSSEAISCRNVYFIDTVQPSEKKLVKTSRNASNLVSHEFISREEFFSLVSSLPPLIALEITTDSTDIFLSNYQKNIGFVVGDESKGISQEMLAICKTALHLPMTGINSSLNVANALCVALYDWQRRHRY